MSVAGRFYAERETPVARCSHDSCGRVERIQDPVVLDEGTFDAPTVLTGRWAPTGDRAAERAQLVGSHVAPASLEAKTCACTPCKTPAYIVEPSSE